VPEDERGQFVQAPRSAPRAAAAVPWEGSLSEARARAQAEGQTLLIYHRGQGLGLGVPYWDELVSGAQFVERTRGAVLVLCDAQRRTFVDRRHDGRRLDCPQFGAVTCGEHVRAEEEFRAWYKELFSEVPGESEEGLWLLNPKDERPTRVQDFEKLAIDSGDRIAAPFAAMEASLGGEDGGSEARALVAIRSRAAREAQELILWEGFSSSPARGYLLSSLAEDSHPYSRELVAVCARQTADPELELAALEIWPAGSDLAAVRHALRWSPSAAVRAAAEKVLLRENPQDPVCLARRALAER